jgi:sortase A
MPGTEIESITDVDGDDVSTVPAPRSRTARYVRGFGWLFINVGLFLVGFVIHALFITTYFSQQNQTALGEERLENFRTAVIEEVEWTPPTDVVAVPDPQTGELINQGPTETLTIRRESVPPSGEAFAIIRADIPSLANGWNVVEGVTVSDLKNGAGHMPGTPLPGQPGNSVIAGHRTTYGAPFSDLDLLEIGDPIEVETALGLNIYVVREVIIVKPTDVWVTDNRDGAWLTLTTCEPKFSARQRLIVFAELVSGPNAATIQGSL